MLALEMRAATSPYNYLLLSSSPMKTDQLILDHEQATIKAFVLRDKQERLLLFAASAKHRKNFTSVVRRYQRAHNIR